MTTASAAVASGEATKNQKKKKKRNKSTKVPKPGEDGFKTATQLRNARKRRAKQQKAQGKSSHGGGGESSSDGNKSAASADPSSQYLADPESAPIVRTAKAFFKSLNQDFDVHVGETQGWRTVAKLAVRSSEGDKVSIGLFAPNSHKLIPVPNCVAHHPSINEAVAVLERLCTQNNVSAFDETTGKGYLRHVAMNVERATGKVQITLVWNAPPYSDGGDDAGKNVMESLSKAIVAVGGGREGEGRKRRRGRKGNDDDDETKEGAPVKEELKLHSLWVHFNASWKHANAIFSIDGGVNSWKHVHGPTVIEERLKLPGQEESIALQFPPNVFRQANIDAFTNIVHKIRMRISENFSKTGKKPSCVELYGGVGTIGLNIADLVSALISSDENPHNKECFLAAAKDLNKVSYESKNATAMMRSNALEKGELIVVDPPRKGLDDEVLSAICSAKTPELLVYVSCGFDAFQRDCKALQNSGWKLDHAEGHLLFPGSDAIETLAFFTHAK